MRINTKLILKIMAGAGILLAAGKAINIFDDINKNARVLSDKEAWTNLGDDDSKRYANAQSELEQLDGIEDRIAEITKKATEKIKEELNYKKHMSEISKGYSKVVTDTKNDMCYDEKRKQLGNLVEETVESFKKSINYDEKVKDINKKIAEAKADYDKAKAALPSLDGDSGDKVKKILKEGKNDKINKLKEELKELDSRIEGVKKSASETATKDIMDLDKKLADALAEPKMVRDTTIRDLNNTVELKVSEIKKHYLAENAIDELDVMLEKDRYSDIISKIETTISDNAEKLYSEMPFTRKLGEYLKFKNVRKITVQMVALLPLALVGYVIKIYRKKVKEVTKWM